MDEYLPVSEAVLMRKAVLLLAMVTIMAGCIYLKNADRDTVLYHQRVKQDVRYAGVRGAESTKEDKDIKESLDIPVSGESAGLLRMLKICNGPGMVYELLPGDEKTIYSQILESLTSLKETELSTTDEEVVDKVFTCVMLDNPGIFYVDGYKYTEYMRNEQVEKIVFSGNYLYEPAEIATRFVAVEDKVADILKGMPDTGDEYLKVKYLYDTLITGTHYELSAADNQNICSVFLNGKSVCQGYAKAFQYLANRAGIECSLVLGHVKDGEEHTWNQVAVNDNWYYLDATWGDASYLFGDSRQAQRKETSVINYDYLCVSAALLFITHKPDMPVELPQCVAMADNYYVREGLFFTGYDGDRLADIFDSAYEQGKKTVTLKCSNHSVYRDMYRVLLDEQRIFEFIRSDGTVAYTDNKEQMNFTFWLFEGRY